MGSSRFMKGIWCFTGVSTEGFMVKVRGFDQEQVKGSKGLWVGSVQVQWGLREWV